MMSKPSPHSLSLATIGAMTLSAGVLIFRYDVCNHICMALRPYRRWQLDNVVLLGLVLAIGALATLVVRERHLRKELLAREHERQLAIRRAEEDPLTGLPNRRALAVQLKNMAAANLRPTVFAIDLDGFKQINDELGHQAGDTVLCMVADRLSKQAAAMGDAIAVRLGGDEFALIISRRASRGEVDTAASQILAAIEAPLPSGRTLSASIGAASIEPGSDNLEDVFQAADRAMYEAKHSRSQIRIDPRTIGIRAHLDPLFGAAPNC